MIKKLVEVFSGDEVKIEAKCNQYLLGEVIEKFGKNIQIEPVNEEFIMKLTASSLGFKLWTMRNMDMVTVLKPAKLVNEIKKVIEDANKRYNQ